MKGTCGRLKCLVIAAGAGTGKTATLKIAGRVQAVLRQVFRRWGRPRRLRLDNGVPWGSMVDLPAELTLWLLGLDIGITFNPPGRPQDNGVIERSQGRWSRFGA